MIKIYESTETSFNHNGLGCIQPLKCIETKKISLNGWYIECEVSVAHNDMIAKDNIVVVETKERGAQPFRIGSPTTTNNVISFTANHVAFDAERYLLADVRPTNLLADDFLKYINARTDTTSPFTMSSNLLIRNTRYFIRKDLLSALEITEELFGLQFEIDKFHLYLKSRLGSDSDCTLIYKKNVESIKIYENWNDVCTKILPVGPDGLLLPELYLEADVQYTQPFTKTVTFEIATEDDSGNEKTTDELITELRASSLAYLEENKYPKINYTLKSDINQELSIGDTVTIKHPLVSLNANVQSYVYNTLTKRVTSIEFGNYQRDVRKQFNNLKSAVTTAQQAKQTANKALVSANRKNTNYYGPDEPSNPRIDDLWYKQNGEYTELWRYTTDGWILILDDLKGIDLSKEMAENAKLTQDAVIAGQDAKLAGEQAKVAGQTAIDLANQSIVDSSTALVKADSAVAQANNAIQNSNLVKVTADNALTQSITAISNSNNAITQAKEALDAYNNLEIGGRNLIFNSNTRQIESYSSPTITHVTDVSVSEWGASNAYRAYGKSGTHQVFATFYAQRMDGNNISISGKSYVHSIYIKNNHASNVLEVGNNINAWVSINPGESKRVVMVGIGTGNTSIRFYFQVSSTGIEFDFTYWHPQIEIGTIVTDWTPAPEDVQIQIDTINGELSLKVSQTTFNTLQNTVNSQATQITANTNAIALKANQTELNTLSGKVSVVESSLNVQAGEITAVNSLVNNHTTQISTLTSNYNSLSSTISSVRNDLDSLSVGGTNLLKGTKDFSGVSSKTYVTTDTYRDFIIAHVDKTSDSTTSYSDLNFTNQIEPEPSTWYTLSFWAKGTGHFTSYFYPSNVEQGITSQATKTTGADGNINTTVSSEWKRYWVSWKTLSTTSGVKNVLVARVYGGKDIYVCGVKFELGNKSTDWSPAPEELTTVVEFSNFQQTVEGFQVTVNSSLASHESKITLLSNSLNSTITDLGTTDLKTRMANGLVVTTDPTFLTGLNGITAYNNNGNGTVAVTRENPTDGTQPTGSAYRVKIVSTGNATPNFGGFYRNNYSRVNAEFIVRFIALLPTGRQFNDYNNSIGTGGTKTWLTSKEGTGTWTEYMYHVKCGSSGTFSTFGHIAVSGGTTPTTSEPLTWWLALYEVIDITASQQSQITQLSTDINFRVQKNDVVNQINISTESILIAGNKLHITATTTIDNAVIKTAHLVDASITNAKIADLAVSTAKIADAAITNAKIGALAVGTANIANAAITDAKISSLSADKITTGTLNAANINVINLNASSIVSGTLSAIDISGSTITGSTIKGNTITGGTITGVSLYATTGTIGGWTISNNTLSSASSSYKIYLDGSNNRISFSQALATKSIYVGSANNGVITIAGGLAIATGYIYCHGSFVTNVLPNISSSYDLGNTSKRWKNIYLSNQPNVSSDIRLKKDIEEIDEEFASDLIMSLKPKQYKMKDSDYDVHYGFVAQDVQEVLYSWGLEESSALLKNGEYLSLAYMELMSPLIKTVQMQNRKIEQLNNIVSNLVQQTSVC